VPHSRLLDAIVFSSPGRPWRDVMVAGRWQIKDHDHPLARQVAGRFEDTMGRLWRDAPH
jgi:formimidoylglutamate deiminase